MIDVASLQSREEMRSYADQTLADFSTTVTAQGMRLDEEGARPAARPWKCPIRCRNTLQVGILRVRSMLLLDSYAAMLLDDDRGDSQALSDCSVTRAVSCLREASLCVTTQSPSSF